MKQMKIAGIGIAGLVLVPLLPVLVSGPARCEFGSTTSQSESEAGYSIARDKRSQVQTPQTRSHALVVAQQGGSAGSGGRIALVIGNATYPDDNKPLSQPVKDARAVAEELRRVGFEVVTGEDLTKQKLRAALDNFKTKIKSGSAALLFYSGYGIQTAKQSYIIPVDAQIWTEGEVRRDGSSVESILSDMNAAGATVKVVIIDAARRNPFERRFRGFSGGLASLNAPAGTLAMYSAAPDKVADESEGENSLFVGELLKEMRLPNQTAELIFNHTRVNVSRASKNQQVPSVSSSLVEDFYFGRAPSQTTVAVTPPPTKPSPAPAVESKRPPVPSKPAFNAPREKDLTIQGLDDAVVKNPSDADAYYKRGQAYAERREYALATEDFGQAIRLNPRDAEAFNNRCWTRAVLGQLQMALADCNEALRLRPNFADAFDSRGLTNLKLGQYDRAIADFDAALRLNSKLASSLYGRGKAKLKRGDRTGGNADIRTAKTMDPKIDEDFASFGFE